MKKSSQLIFFISIFLIFNIISVDVAQLPYGNLDAMLTFVKKYLPNNPNILEAGSYDGVETLKLSNIWPEGKVYTFEPVPSLFSKVKSITNSKKNISCYDFALSDKIGKAKLYLSEIEGIPEISASSSLLPPKEHLKYSHVVFKKETEVNTITLDVWAKENKVDSIDFFWLDMQGYELNALMHAQELLKTTKVIVTEVEFVEAYEGQYLYEDVKKWLEQKDFVLVAKNFNIAEHWFGDAIFVKKDLVNA